MLGLLCVGWANLSADVLDTVENWPEKVNRGCSGGGGAGVAGVSKVGVGSITVVEDECFCRMANAPWSLKNA